MISRIFFDLDETLFHTIVGGSPPEQEHFEHWCEVNVGLRMFTIFNPLAYPLLEHARNLVGNENVLVLTSSLRFYAERLCERGGYGFRSDQIFTREDLHEHRYSGAYGMGYTIPGNLADENNVLIDNLPPRENDQKIVYLGIRDWRNRYIQVRDYFGVNFPNDSWADDIIEKLNELHK
jgi:hypothetical protein